MNASPLESSAIPFAASPLPVPGFVALVPSMYVPYSRPDAAGLSFRANKLPGLC